MRIYEAEKRDGIDFQLNQAGSSTAFVTSKVRVGNIEKYFDGMSVSDIVKATSTVQTVEELIGQEQPDLALVVAILVSTGWNLNDDIFTPEEVWKARSSPLHKPMNDQHNATSILGHIVKSRVLDKSGKEIEDDGIVPDEFDIEVAGVLYRAFPELEERIEEIISKANSGEMFVSMECWFPDFDYGLINPDDGAIKLIERTEATAFLTKHLRIYGGCGDYQGYKVGRVLRNMIFGAQGFVEEPANPGSVIKVAASKAAAPQVFVTAELSDLTEGGVEDVDEKEKKELQAKLEEAQANLKSKTEEVTELQKAAEEAKTKDFDGQIATLNEKVDELTASIADASEKMEAVEVEKVELQKKLDEVTERADKSVAELETIRKNETARDRLLKLSNVKKVEDEEATLAELREMTKETFDIVLKYAGEAKSEEVVDDKSKEKTEATKTDETEKEDDQEQAEAALDNVEENDTPDFNAKEDAKESEDRQWKSAAHLLCGRTDETDEGGE